MSEPTGKAKGGLARAQSLTAERRRQIAVQAAAKRWNPPDTPAKAESASVSISRSFRDLSDAEVADIDKASRLSRIGWTGSFGWDEMLRSHRVLMVSEAGVGKTYECQQQ